MNLIHRCCRSFLPLFLLAAIAGVARAENICGSGAGCNGAYNENGCTIGSGMVCNCDTTNPAYTTPPAGWACAVTNDVPGAFHSNPLLLGKPPKDTGTKPGPAKPVLKKKTAKK